MNADELDDSLEDLRVFVDDSGSEVAQLQADASISNYQSLRLAQAAVIHSLLLHLAEELAFTRQDKATRHKLDGQV